MNLRSVSAALCGGLAILCAAWAQQRQETTARPLTKRQEKKKEAQLRKELQSSYRRWEDEVQYILTDEERAAFHGLRTDEEREQFIEQFWLRRDPSPDTEENEYKEEYYRRIAYANEHFASGIPGWRTDRGRIYITRGAPDEIDDHSSGGFYERPAAEGGGETSTFPFQVWRYRHLDGVGEDINLEFVDPTMSGEFRLTIDPSEKDALLYVPGAGLTWMEQQGMASKTDRFNNPDGTHLAAPFGALPESMNEFSRLALMTNMMKAPPVKYPDLENVTSVVRYDMLPFQLRSDLFPLTESSVLASITVQVENRDLEFRASQGVQRAVLRIQGEISTITNRLANRFESEVSVDTSNGLLPIETARKAVFNRIIPLAPGTYRLRVTIKDVNAGTVNRREMPMTVPRLDPEKMSASSLVLADLIERVPPKNLGTGPFVLGDLKVRPRMDASFRRDEEMGVYLKVYNTGTREGQVTYEVRNSSGEKVQEQSVELSQVPGASAAEVTLQKQIDLRSLDPGRYTLQVRVRGNGEVAPSAEFTVK